VALVVRPDDNDEVRHRPVLKTPRVGLYPLARGHCGLSRDYFAGYKIRVDRELNMWCWTRIWGVQPEPEQTFRDWVDVDADRRSCGKAQRSARRCRVVKQYLELERRRAFWELSFNVEPAFKFVLALVGVLAKSLFLLVIFVVGSAGVETRNEAYMRL